MGLLTRFRSMLFGSRPAPRRAEAHVLASAVNGASAGQDSADEDGPLVEVRPLAVAGGAGAPAVVSRKSRQELMDDLEKSYREVVELVRKVDAHLDKADQRAERMGELADQLLRAVENLPSREHDEQARQRQIELLSQMVEEQRAGVDRLDNTLARLGVQAEVAGQSHEQLVMTMAEFRETMCDVSRASGRSAQAIEASTEQKRQADERLARAIVGNQRWMIGILAASMVLAAGALVLAVIAVVRLGG